jgi:hypothetical protein
MSSLLELHLLKLLVAILHPLIRKVGAAQVVEKMGPILAKLPAH